MNEFEQRLKQVPVKRIPADWRAEILAAAKVGQASSLSSERASAGDSKPSERGIYATSTRTAQAIRELFWPHPKAWAGLAAVWLVIVGLHLSQRDEPLARMVAAAPPTPEMQAELHQQQKLLAELLDVPVVSDADRPRTKPAQPHTQVVRTMRV